MWISKRITKDPDVKKTLREIAGLIEDHADATNVGRERRFFAANIGGLLKPRVWPYIVALCVTVVMEVLLLWTDVCAVGTFGTWINLSLTVACPILVLGLSLATVARGVSESSRFASEYLKESCRIEMVACFTFLTVFWGFLGRVLLPVSESAAICMVAYIVFSGFSVGGAAWCLLTLIYIIIETTKCMDPEFSIEVAAGYASRKVSHAMLKDMYLATWMRRHADILDDCVKGLDNIHRPAEYYTESMREKKNSENKEAGKYAIDFAKEIDFHCGYRDYNIKELRKVDKLLGGKKAQLYLAPHGSFSKQFGLLYYEKPCREVYDEIHERLGSICKFKKDKYIEEKPSFWEEQYVKLDRAFLKATVEGNISQFRKYLSALEQIYSVLRKRRKQELVDDDFRYGYDYKKARYLFLYSRSVKWLIERKELEEDTQEMFLDSVVDSIWNQVADEISNGEWRTLDIFKWLVPKIYQLFVDGVRDKKSRLWELRARVGGFYSYVGNLLSEDVRDIKEDERIQIKLVLHKGIIRWLLTAMDNKDKDHELIRSLCETGKKLVFSHETVTFEPRQLAIQHFILCGKMLELIMDGSESIFPSTFKLLWCDRYSDMPELDIDFDELARFFVESRNNHSLRDSLREFSTTDWEMDPLGGVGHGTPSYTFSGHIELDYMFIYLALLRIHFLGDVGPIACEFSGYGLKEKIEKFRSIASSVGIADFEGSQERLVQWLEKCNELYKQQEEERIAIALLSKEKVSQFSAAFVEGYRNVKTFLGFCIGRGYYSIDDEACIKGGYVHRKELFIDGPLSPDGIGGRDGADVARRHDKRLLKNIIRSGAEGEEGTSDSIISAFNQGCLWLARQGTNKENGILLFHGNIHIQRELYSSEYYVPSWKEERNLVFSAYYRNYPIIEVYERDVSPKCVALDLQGWNGLEIRPDVLEKDVLCDVSVREWREDEIKRAIGKGEIKVEDSNRHKGSCLVEYELFWRLNEKLPPKQMVFSVITEKSSDGEGVG